MTRVEFDAKVESEVSFAMWLASQHQKYRPFRPGTQISRDYMCLMVLETGTFRDLAKTIEDVK